MKRIAFFLLTLLLLVSCGTRSGYFKMEGRFLHMNSGELYLYSPDGGIAGIDTIRVEAGRFAYEMPCAAPSTLVIIFPNFSTQPIFAESGEDVEIKIDASHLKEMEVKGTKDNELMTKFRKDVSSVSPPEELKTAIQFVNDHPESPVSVYLVRKYLIESMNPDYRQARVLVRKMMAVQPKNPTLAHLNEQLSEQSSLTVGSRLPKFSLVSTEGKTITSASLAGKTTIINAWALWSYESMDIQRALNDAYKEGKINVIGICLEPDSKEAARQVKNNLFEFPNVCDGKMLQSPYLRLFGFSEVPDNIVIKNGKVVEQNITANTIRQRLADGKL